MALTRTEKHVAASSTAPGATREGAEILGLNISIRTGTGSGRTLLSAFDHALMGAGVADFNLVTLSSVIPTASRIRHVEGTLPGGHGDLLYCVRAEAFADRPGDTAWAGLGWVTDETGGGLFVEHHGHTEASVIEQIEHSLGDMNRTRGGRYGDVQMTLASARCVDQPVCALVLAAYRVASWHDDGVPVGQAAAHKDRLVASPPAASPAPASGPGGTHSQVIDEWVGTGVTAAAEERPASSESPVARVTLEKEVDFATARTFWELYRATFGELEGNAAGRQLLHESEFLEEMLDPRVHKYVAWDAEERAIGMTTLTTDLETVPWVSPTYFARNYPDHHARGNVYYLGFTLVHPDHQGTHVFHSMAAHMFTTVFADESLVLGWDMCLANDEGGFGGSAGRLLMSFAEVDIEQIDRQNYYAATIRKPSQTPYEHG